MSRYQKDLPPIPPVPPRGTTYTYTSPPNLRKQQPPQTSEHYQAVLKQQNRRLQEQKDKLHQTIAQQEEKIAHLQRKIKEYRQYIKKQNENFIQVTQTVCSAFESYRERAVAMPAENLSPSPIDQVIGAYAAFSDSEGDFF
ncbi:hypothetical protein TrVFT333_006814 [Trichoderma virens FT-333]|nr:hypothetical protein TrVFT333_006814 [Trichoderma virens FT-333]